MSNQTKDSSGSAASKRFSAVFRVFLLAGLFVICSAVSLILLEKLLLLKPAQSRLPENEVLSVSLMECFDKAISRKANDVEEALFSAPKKYWIPEEASTPPKPDQTRYGQTEDPASLQWLLEDAAVLLEGQETIFSTDTEIMPGSVVHYYLDDTILAITWKQVFDDFVYTMSEVKISDPSQLRRYIAGETYGSQELYVTSRMAASVNAVVASSGDFYMGRKHGISVYDGTVYKANYGNIIDTCFIDDQGELLFAYRGELTDQQSAQQYVDDHNISFSLSFGPVLIDQFQRCEPAYYPLGEVNDGYPRAALCQKDKLHYLVLVANLQGKHRTYPTIHTFASWVETFGCEKAYALDGGQTGVIVMNNEVINDVQFHFERKISDIFYFATAYPDFSDE